LLDGNPDLNFGNGIAGYIDSPWYKLNAIKKFVVSQQPRGKCDEGVVWLGLLVGGGGFLGKKNGNRTLSYGECKVEGEKSPKKLTGKKIRKAGSGDGKQEPPNCRGKRINIQPLVRQRRKGGEKIYKKTTVVGDCVLTPERGGQ